MNRRLLYLIAIGSLLFAAMITMVIPAKASNNATDSTQQCFNETGHCISGRFLQYWQQNGGLPVFGYPTTDPINEVNPDTGKSYLTQWFERNRFELHNENAAPYDVLLGRLGDQRLHEMGIDWTTQPQASGPQSGCLWFSQTKHNVCDQGQGIGFLSYWQSHGLEFDGQPGHNYAESLALFGLPLTEVRSETNSSGDTVPTQWFERARFEWHADKPDQYKVLLGLLGNEVKINLTKPTPTPAPTETPRPTSVGTSCSDVPDPVNGTIEPGKCVNAGTTIYMNVFGFSPNETINYWLVDAQGNISGAQKTDTIGRNGSKLYIWDTTGMASGNWSWVYRAFSGYQATIYFKIN